MLSIVNYNVFPRPAHISFFFYSSKLQSDKLRLNSQRQASAFVKHSPDILSEAFTSTGRITSSKEKKYAHHVFLISIHAGYLCVFYYDVCLFFISLLHFKSCCGIVHCLVCLLLWKGDGSCPGPWARGLLTDSWLLWSTAVTCRCI